MAKAKKGVGAKPPTDLWELYQSLQLTPEQKAEARAELERKAAVAREAGVYTRLLEAMGKVHLEYDIDELREDAVRWGENPSMAKTKKDAVAEVSTDSWEYYRSIQRTPEQKAEARAELERKAAAAAEAGAYQRLYDLLGKVHLEYDIDELREDRD